MLFMPHEENTHENQTSFMILWRVDHHPHTLRCTQEQKDLIGLHLEMKSENFRRYYES